MKTRYLMLACFSSAVITLDQATKMYVHTQFRLSESLAVIRGFFSITYVRNFGAAFNLLSGVTPSFRQIFFVAVPPLALIIILLILRTLSDRDRLQIISLSLVFGGAVGNYIDRLRFRYVIDFLDFHIKSSFSWPAFNIADTAIVCGLGILLLIMIFHHGDTAEETAGAAESPQEQ